MKCNELSPFIYDRKTGKINHMTDYLWIGLSLAINAKSGRYGPIGIESCMDFKRLVNKERIDNSFGNAYTNFALCVQNPSPKMTIGEICSKMRSNFNLFSKNDWFYKEYLFPLEFLRENFQVTSVSNVGPIKIKSPFKDVYMQATGKEKGLRPYLQITSFSKCIEGREAGLNDLVIQLRYSLASVSNKTAKDIFDTYIYFLKSVDPSKKSGDVLDELIHFQKSL